MSPSFPFQLQCREHTVVIGTHIFPPGALQPAYWSRCGHPYYHKGHLFPLFHYFCCITATSTHLSVSEKFSTWQQITVDELLAYMGFMILMGSAATHDTRLLEDNQHISLLACHW